MLDILSFNEFLLEKQEFSLSFKIDDSGKVEILGRTYKILEFIKDYDYYVEYVFATYFDKKLMYFPLEKRFKIVKSHEKGKYFDVSPDRVKFRSVKVKPVFITDLEIESTIKSTKDAIDYRRKDYHVEIIDYENKVIDTYQIDQKTGELK